MTPRERALLAGVVLGLERRSLAVLKAEAEAAGWEELVAEVALSAVHLTEAEPEVPTVEDMRAIFFPEDEAT